MGRKMIGMVTHGNFKQSERRWGGIGYLYEWVWDG